MPESGRININVHAHAYLSILWLAAFACKLWLCAVLLTRWRKYPLFALFALAVTAKTAGLLWASASRSDAMYFHVHWTMVFAMYALAAAAAIAEIKSVRREA